MSRERIIAECNEMIDHSEQNPILFIRIHVNKDSTREEYRWSFIVVSAHREAISSGERGWYWIGWHLELLGNNSFSRFESHQDDLRETFRQEGELVRLLIAEVKNLIRLDRVLSSVPSAAAIRHPNTRSLGWVKEQLGGLVAVGCLKGQPDSFEEIEKQGRVLAQRSILLGQTLYASRLSTMIDKEGEAVGKSKETQQSKETPPSPVGSPDKPTTSMGPPLLPASATRGKRNKDRDQAAGTQALVQGRKYFTMDDLPIYRPPKVGVREPSRSNT